MEFRTKVELPAKGPKIQHTDRLMIWGFLFFRTYWELTGRT